MTFALKDRVRETSITTGTGTYTLDGAATGFQTFAAAIGNGNTCLYVATDDVNWETGVGTVATGPDRLARTTVLESSNAGAAVNWAAGTRDIFVGPLGSRTVMKTGALTSGRLPLVSTDGQLADNAGIGYSASVSNVYFNLSAAVDTQVGAVFSNTHASGYVSVVHQTSGTGDAYSSYSVNSAATVAYAGVDRSAAAYVIGIGATPGLADAISVSSAGLVSLPNGQLKFPATQNPSADANTLDDYEEGTWTISFTFATPGDLALSAETKEAYYIKTGQNVLVYWTYTFTPTFTTSSGVASLTGLPFTHRNVTNANCVARGSLRHNANVTYNASHTMLGVNGVDNGTTMQLTSQGSGVAASVLQVARFTTAVSTELHGSLDYQATA